MALRSGDLDRIVMFSSPSPVTDDGLTRTRGGFVERDKRWAKRTDVSDAERVRASQQGRDLTARFLVRSDTFTRTIDETFRLSSEGTTFEIVSAKEWGGRRNGVEISALAMSAAQEAAEQPEEQQP